MPYVRVMVDWIRRLVESHRIDGLEPIRSDISNESLQDWPEISFKMHGMANSRDDELPSPPAGLGMYSLELPDRESCMDFSLVLVSEGIETIPVSSISGDHWGLWVEIQDSSRTGQILTKWTRDHAFDIWNPENVVHPQEIQPFPFINGWILGWLAFLVVVFVAGPFDNSPIKAAGILNQRSWEHHEWYRLLTSICLHKDAGHLVLNLISGWGFTSLASWRYGAGVTLLSSLMAGILANALFTWTQIQVGPHWASLGASGMVFASLGMCIDFRSPTPAPHPHRGNPFLRFRSLIASICMIALFGLSPDSNWMAHCAGFAFGGWIGWTWQSGAFIQKHLKKPISEALAILIFFTLLTMSWQFARHG